MLVAYGGRAVRAVAILFWTRRPLRATNPNELLVVRGWRCRYDLATGRFDVPASFARHNAKAIAPERK